MRALKMADEMRFSDRCVFILGAGSSAPYGPPVMNNFMDTARRMFEERKRSKNAAEIVPCYEALLRFYDQCRASAWAFKRNWENMEELYTQADLRRLSGIPDGPEAEDLCDKIAWTIWDVYRRCQSSFKLETICRQVMGRHLRPVIITTNYDLVCELCPLSNSSPALGFYYPGFGEIDEHKGVSFESGSADEPADHRKKWVPIIKLHGSANWFKVGDHWLASHPCPQLAAPEFAIPEFKKQLVEFAKRTCPDVADTSKVAPAIIPPMLGKASVATAVRLQWKAAIDAIASARQIWVIGYSFPTTDAFMTRLLTEGMQQNRDFELLVIVDQQPWSAWKPRIEGMLGNMLHEYRLKYLSLNSRAMHKVMAENGHPEWAESGRREALSRSAPAGDWANF